MKKALTYFLSIAAVILFAQAQAFSCSCPTVGGSTNYPVGQWFDASTTVFSGEAIKLEKVPGTRELIATFEIDRFWKGASARFVDVRTQMTEPSCGYNFQIGTSYIVYASGPGKSLTTGRCRGNTSRFDPFADEHITILDRITAPQKDNL